MSETIKVKIAKIIYRNPGNSYTVAQALLDEEYPVTVTGTFITINENDKMILTGEWIDHPKYGDQFNVISYKQDLPKSKNDIEAFLGSGLLKGIGPSLAKRITNHFGDRTLEILDGNIERLKEITGIGDKKFEEISELWNKQKALRDLVIFLQKHEINPNLAGKLYKYYGSTAQEIIKNNPYRLIDDIWGIGFKRADSLAMNLGFTNDSPHRVEAGIQHLLKSLSDDGHVCYPYKMLLSKAAEAFELDYDLMEVSVQNLAKRGNVIIETRLCKSDGPLVYLDKFFFAEHKSAELICSILNLKNPALTKAENEMPQVLEEMNIEFDNIQESAVRKALREKVLILTGGPGTGKTTILKAILKLMTRAGKKVMLAAPTGRAAKRMTETTGYPSVTIHRLLEYSPMEFMFKRDEDYRLECDYLIVDEFSMVDQMLLLALMKAVPAQSGMLLVGDADQLPSVGAGNVFSDMINSGVIPVIKLEKIYRQAEKSLIVKNAHSINHGVIPQFENNINSGDDMFFFTVGSGEKIIETILRLYKEEIPSRFGFDPAKDVQVISPMYKSTAGVNNLNSVLQAALNPDGKTIIKGNTEIRVGDKVMQIRNNYDKDIYNGDIGRVAAFNKREQYFLVNFDDKLVKYEYSEIEELVLAYAITVHKSQGSEYPVLIVPLVTEHYMLLQRNLIYTAVTRGKNLVILIGSKQALAIAVNTNKSVRRFTRLAERLGSVNQFTDPVQPD